MQVFTRVTGAGGAGGALYTPSGGAGPGDVRHLVTTPLRALGHGGGYIYIYIYMYLLMCSLCLPPLHPP